MGSKLRHHFTAELAVSRDALVQGDYQLSWQHLERAHILSQAFAWPHVRVHLAMLFWAWKRKDSRELLGQLVRVIVAAPGSWLGRAPLGNTGGANVGIFRPMPIPPDLQKILSDESR